MEIDLMPGVKVVIDPELWTVKGGLKLTPGAAWSNDLRVSLDVRVRDVIEGNETELKNALELSST